MSDIGSSNVRAFEGDCVPRMARHLIDRTGATTYVAR